MKKVIILIQLIFLNSIGFAQLNTDVQSIFKMYLFLDKENISFRGINRSSSKNDSLYKAFSDVTELKIDTLKGIINDFGAEMGYGFFDLPIYNSEKRSYYNNISYKKKLCNDEEQFFGTPLGEGMII